MSPKLLLGCFFALSILISCSDDEPVMNETLFIEFSLDGVSYKVSDEKHQLISGDGFELCNFMNGYVAGSDGFALWDPKYSEPIHQISFSLTKKVFKDQLNLSDESSYMQRVLQADNYGFPTNRNGFFSVYDPENLIFEVPRNVSAEGYLYIVTKDEDLYSSFSVISRERDPSSFLMIDKVINSTNSTDYQYIVEGRFKVNLFDTATEAESKVVEGKFRWPIGTVNTSELVTLCE